MQPIMLPPMHVLILCTMNLSRRALASNPIQHGACSLPCALKGYPKFDVCLSQITFKYNLSVGFYLHSLLSGFEYPELKNLEQ